VRISNGRRSSATAPSRKAIGVRVNSSRSVTAAADTSNPTDNSQRTRRPHAS
jgi:hypothetical protein